MEIRTQVINRTENSVVEETYIIPIETYRSYSYPEDILQAQVEKMIKAVEKEIPAAEQRGKEMKENLKF